MKKQVFFAIALAMGVSLVSCDKDDDNNKNEEITVTYDDVTASNVKNWTAYATRVATLLKSDATTLYDAWTKSYNGGEAYSVTFKSQKGDYKSALDCLQEIAQGCADIANEVGTAKIGEPYDLYKAGKTTEALYAVESWYSWHSRDDYSNNILSIRNSFYGSLDGKVSDKSIANYLKSKDEAFYNELNSAIDNAYKAIQNIPQPFRNNIDSKEAEQAMEACAALNDLLMDGSKNLNKWLEENEDEATYKAIAENYVDVVVLPTYKSLVDKADALLSAVKAVESEPSTKNFAAAGNAWLEARAPWETSEAFLFGPVGDLGLDPNMDSWPLDQENIKNLIEKGSFDALNWNGDYDEESEAIEAAQSVRGFHTLEYLIFKDGKAREY